MNIKETLDKVVKEIINEKSYGNEIKIFKKYLKKNSLEQKVFKLTTTNIDEYFDYLIKGDKVGSISTSVAHTSALKVLINKLDKLGYNNHTLLGYLESDDFKTEIQSKLSFNSQKEIISIDLIKSTLYKIDRYLEEKIEDKNIKGNKKLRILKVMVARLYIKLSLIIPIKLSEMLEIKVGDINNQEFRNLYHNGVCIRMTNNLRKEIINTIEYFEKEFGVSYNKNDRLFEFLILKYSKTVTTTDISHALELTYKELEIEELLVKKKIGVKNMSVFTAESYKKSAIAYMLRNGVNIVYLKKLTGLDISTLIGDFNLEEEIFIKDAISDNINRSLVTMDYYSYL